MPEEDKNEPAADAKIEVDRLQTTMTMKTEAAPVRPNKVTHEATPVSVASEKSSETPGNNYYYAAAAGITALACAAAYVLIRRK